MEATKNICEGDQYTVTRCFTKFCICFKNLDDQARLRHPKMMYFESDLQAIEANLTSSTKRVSSKHSISLSAKV